MRRLGVLSAAALTWLAAAAPTHAAFPPRPWGSRLFAAEAGMTMEAEVAETAPPAAAAEAPKRRCPCSDPVARARLWKCFPHLVGHDTVTVFTEPARWREREWGLFAAGALGVGTLMFVDDDLRNLVLSGHGGFRDTVAKVFEPFGTWASFLTLGGFYVGGVVAHDEKARGVVMDGLAASFIASIVITPVLKEVTGRSRPREGLGPYHFEPFHGGPSFPSGHATQAFAVASVIATEYPARWVQAACYVPATLVLYARMRHDGHWASDVTAGALIGYGVGHTVARFNLAPRLHGGRVRLEPLFRRGSSGAILSAEF